MAVAPGPVETTPGWPSITTATLLTAGHICALAGGQAAAGGVGSAVGDVTVNAPVESGPLMADAGTAVAHPASAKGLSETGCPHFAGVVPLPQLV